MPVESTAIAPPVVQPNAGNAIIINSCQRLNPLLKEIRNVPKEFGDIVADYQVGRTTGVLFLSLKYHRLHPEYIHQRIEKLGHRYNLRILLILCDISEHQDSIRELTKTCFINNITVIVSWSVDEAAFYLTAFKQSEHKSPNLIRERTEKDYNSILRSALTSIKSINKTDVETLRTNFGSLAGISRAPEKALLDLPGFAQTKVRRLQGAVHKPFFNKPSAGPFSLSQLPAVAAAAQAASAASPAGPSMPAPSPESNTSGEVVAADSRSGILPSAEYATSGTRPPRLPPPRSPSPVWDIELDLNNSADESDSPPSKKQKTDHPASFGQPDSSLLADS